MHEVVTETEINASPSTVWSVLMDFARYPGWRTLSFVNYRGKQSLVTALPCLFAHRETRPGPFARKLSSPSRTPSCVG